MGPSVWATMGERGGLARHVGGGGGSKGGEWLGSGFGGGVREEELLKVVVMEWLVVLEVGVREESGC